VLKLYGFSKVNPVARGHTRSKSNRRERRERQEQLRIICLDDQGV